ncbi:MAG: pirin family protein [Mucilaginibacter sp.]|uniref:pirin family protein n=1 Tax=Mucilaginibacter sp. TaxID=1882438 RepID=UPI0031AB0066
MTDIKFSPVVKLPKVNRGNFSAMLARPQEFGGLMNPLIGFDHFRLTGDVFGPHQHTGMSALSYVFEDSVTYNNQDSMGTNLDIEPGSLLWTWAGSGVTHHEVPVKQDGQVHGLQIFLKIPQQNAAKPPQSVYIPVKEMPVLNDNGIKVKVVAGNSGTLLNHVQTPEPVTILDITMKAGSSFTHELPPNTHGTFYVMSGKVTLSTGERNIDIADEEVISIGGKDTGTVVILRSTPASRVIFIGGLPV